MSTEPDLELARARRAERELTGAALDRVRAQPGHFDLHLGPHAVADDREQHQPSGGECKCGSPFKSLSREHRGEGKQ